ncbi:ankyrin repeat and KH domain-containing protein 1 [Biomphalaria glabrata]|uniref:Ankyrin repeat and KH domain-containing protein 1-like n=2 Tax=Biomphalaria glabrata TaxID=6526 RepID=A0A9U8ELQ9_BIOGL|nr:ankyrin repeat and KH domain-containing protein 1-like [Biomphalaria glabrata]KAI8763690.1 ankyrin repeat and KH domain-containing protein 1-like [Biomphalaria glabrata]
MAETKDQVQLDDAILLKTVASGCATEILKLLRLCNQKTTHFSCHALTWAVFEACSLRHTHLLQFLLKDGSRLELRDNNGNTPLMICSAKGFPEIVSRLLKLGADVNAKNNNGDTALMLTKSREVIIHLLKNKSLHLDEQNQTGNTALMSAIERSDLQKVKLLIIAGANPNRYVTKFPHSSSFSSDDFLVNNSNESGFDVAKRKGFGQLLVLLYRAKMVNLHPLQLAAVENDFDSCITLLKYKLCSKSETRNIRPDILCYVLKQIQKRDIILSSDLQLVRELCRLGMDVNRCQCCIKSRMELVLDIGSYDLAEILCAHGAKLTHDDLVSAVKSKHIEMVPLLVNHGAPVNKFDRLGCVIYKGSAMDIALLRSLTSTASFLFDHGAALDPFCAVSKALMRKKTRTLNFLLKECAEVIKPETLIRAVKLGDIELIQVLLDAGADIDGVHDNKTPLMSAVHIEVFNFLINKGADVNFKTNTTPLINALSQNYFEDVRPVFYGKLDLINTEEKLFRVVDTLVKNGANLEDTNQNGYTALRISIGSRLGVRGLKLLLENGAEVNRKNKHGLTALHVAAMADEYDCAETLLEYGADVNVRCRDGRTPLHRALNNSRLVKLFLKSQANVNAEDSSGNTPLMLSVKERCFKCVVKLLIAFGADVNHKDRSGKSPLWLAAENEETTILPLLLDANADLDQDNQRQKSVLSMLLNHSFLSEEIQRTAIKLIEHGADADFVRRGIIHHLIAAGNDGILIQKLIKSGIWPTDISLRRRFFGWPGTSVSPLAVSLILDSLDLARFFIKNWYLTKADVKLLSRNIDILTYLERRKRKALPYLEKVSRQPMRLELLCFITVSSALGSDSSRHQRVHNSKLPASMQNRLLFANLELKVLEPVSRDMRLYISDLLLKDDYGDPTSSPESSIDSYDVLEGLDPLEDWELM